MTTLLMIQEANHFEEQVSLKRVQMSVYSILEITGVRVYFKM